MLQHYSLLFVLVLFGCAESTDSRTAISETQTQLTAANESVAPWGGFRIRTSGTELTNAKQIVILLHGYGTDESDLASIADYIGGDSRAFVFPAAPITVDGGGFAWATTENELKNAHSRLVSLVRFASHTYPNAEIAVGGFSQGATVSSMLLSNIGLPIRHLILYSPALAIDATSINPDCNINVFLAHGERDKVLPFEDSKRLSEMLRLKKIRTNWHPFDDGHTITTELLDATRDQLSDDRA